jgi:hypothetical protein
MKSLAMSIVVVAVLACACTGPRLNAQEKGKFTAKDLPAAVIAAFEKAYPKAKILTASTETEKGVTYYEIESMDGTQRRDLLYMKDGTVFEAEEITAPSDLPETVKVALSKNLPNGKILSAEKTTRQSGVQYDLTVQIKRKKFDVSIDGAGKVLSKKEVKARNKNAEKEEEGEEQEKD